MIENMVVTIPIFDAAGQVVGYLSSGKDSGAILELTVKPNGKQAPLSFGVKFDDFLKGLNFLRKAVP